MPWRPGFQPVIIDGHAAAVIGGTVERSDADAPFGSDRGDVRQVGVSLPDDGVRAAVEPDHEQPGHEPAGTSIALCTRSATVVRCSPAAGTEDISPAWS